MNDCVPFRQHVGAYLLHGLDDLEAGRIEDHLMSCAGCRAEHAELARLLPLLEAARDAPPRVPGRVRDRVIAKAARRHTARRWAIGAVAAAIAGLLLGGVLALQLPARQPPALAVPLEQVEPFAAEGWATFRADDGRLLVRLDIDGLDPLDAPAVYEAWLRTTDDRTLSIGHLDVGPEGAVAAELSTDGPMDRYESFWITAEPDIRDPGHDGPTVLRAPVPPRP